MKIEDTDQVTGEGMSGNGDIWVVTKNASQPRRGKVSLAEGAESSKVLTQEGAFNVSKQESGLWGHRSVWVGSGSGS